MKKKFWTSKWCRGFIWIYTAIGYFLVLKVSVWMMTAEMVNSPLVNPYGGGLPPIPVSIDISIAVGGFMVVTSIFLLIKSYITEAGKDEDKK